MISINHAVNKIISIHKNIHKKNECGLLFDTIVSIYFKENDKIIKIIDNDNNIINKLFQLRKWDNNEKTLRDTITNCLKHIPLLNINTITYIINNVSDIDYFFGKNMDDTSLYLLIDWERNLTINDKILLYKCMIDRTINLLEYSSVKHEINIFQRIQIESVMTKVSYDGTKLYDIIDDDDYKINILQALFNSDFCELNLSDDFIKMCIVNCDADTIMRMITTNAIDINIICHLSYEIFVVLAEHVGDMFYEYVLTYRKHNENIFQIICDHSHEKIIYLLKNFNERQYEYKHLILEGYDGTISLLAYLLKHNHKLFYIVKSYLDEEEICMAICNSYFFNDYDVEGSRYHAINDEYTELFSTIYAIYKKYSNKSVQNTCMNVNNNVKIVESLLRMCYFYDDLDNYSKLFETSINDNDLTKNELISILKKICRNNPLTSLYQDDDNLLKKFTKFLIYIYSYISDNFHDDILKNEKMDLLFNFVAKYDSLTPSLYSINMNELYKLIEIMNVDSNIKNYFKCNPENDYNRKTYFLILKYSFDKQIIDDEDIATILSNIEFDLGSLKNKLFGENENVKYKELTYFFNKLELIYNDVMKNIVNKEYELLETLRKCIVSPIESIKKIYQYNAIDNQKMTNIINFSLHVTCICHVNDFINNNTMNMMKHIDNCVKENKNIDSLMQHIDIFLKAIFVSGNVKLFEEVMQKIYNNIEYIHDETGNNIIHKFFEIIECSGCYYNGKLKYHNNDNMIGMFNVMIKYVTNKMFLAKNNFGMTPFHVMCYTIMIIKYDMINTKYKLTGNFKKMENDYDHMKKKMDNMKKIIEIMMDYNGSVNDSIDLYNLSPLKILLIADRDIHEYVINNI
jgi:hypothetical protein